MKVCKKCRGRGQTPHTGTEFHFEKKVRPDGQKYNQYVTDKQGSGCPHCLGRGVKE